MISIVPSLIDALVTQATAALPAIRVYDGYGISSDPGDFLMIGVDDPDGPDPANTAAGQLAFATMRTAPGTRDEQGELVCAALSWNGNADMKGARDAVQAIATAVDTFTRADPSLGLAPSLLWALVGSNYDYSQQQDGEGAQALLVFRIGYRARI